MSEFNEATDGRISRKIRLGLFLIVLFFLFLHTIFPSTTVDTTTLGLLVLMVFILLLPYVSEIGFPGGGHITLGSLRRVREAVKKLPVQASVEQRVAGSSDVSPQGDVWRKVLAEDVHVALAGLRIEIESRLQKLAGTRASGKFESALGLITLLQSERSLTPIEADAIRSVVQVCNEAVHARHISAEAAQETADLGEFVLRFLHAKLERNDRLNR